MQNDTRFPCRALKWTSLGSARDQFGARATTKQTAGQSIDFRDPESERKGEGEKIRDA